jgi:sortase A
MFDNRRADDLTVEELEALLYSKKRTQRQSRLRRMRGEGRLIEVAGLPPPNPEPPPLIRPTASVTGAMQNYVAASGDDFWDSEDEDMYLTETVVETPAKKSQGIKWRWIADKSLVFVEILAVFGFFYLIFSFLDTSQELNQELAAVQAAESASLVLPTATPEPIIGVVVLPTGHKPPVEGRPPEPGEAGYIPEHLQPLINNYVPPPLPTPNAEQARRIQIPALNVDSTIVQGDDWGQLKKGVGQHVGSAQPGQNGNLVLSAHNDIYGEIFRHLDKLAPGDEIIISTERQTYTYVVRDIDVVEPTAVEVMAPTEHASSTLISCYPYLVNNKRIVVFADLADS